MLRKAVEKTVANGVPRILAFIFSFSVACDPAAFRLGRDAGYTAAGFREEDR
jgi:hypothetical protein